MEKELLKKFYQDNMYGKWRSGETVTYERLGEDPKTKDWKRNPFNPFEVVGGELVKIKVEQGGKNTEFIVHAYIPESTDYFFQSSELFKGYPFIICMHPITPKDYALSQGYALFFLESTKIASDDMKHEGAFYDIYPYREKPESQTGVLMAWAWGASKVLDAVYNGLGKELNLDPEASMVTGVSRYGKATAVCGAFDERFRMVIPACSGAGGLALYNFVSEGKVYDFRKCGGPAEYTYGKNEPLSCLQSEAERGWFNDKFLEYEKTSDIPYDQENLINLALDKNRYYFVIASYMGEDWVNAPAMWECFKKADEEFSKANLSDHLVASFHKEGHAVIQEDMERIVTYFNHMYYGMDTGVDIKALKTSLFVGQESGNAERLRLRPYKKEDSVKIAEWLHDETVFIRWGGERFGSFPVSAEDIDRKYSELNGDCEQYDNFYPVTAYTDDAVVGHFIIRYINNSHDVLRLGWVIVDDSKRGKGYGKRMLELSIKMAFEIMKAKKLTIGVFENNTPAYKCYKSLGFTEAEVQDGHTSIIDGKECKVIELELVH